MTRRLAFVPIVIAFALAIVSAPSAKDGDVLVRGKCSKVSASKLKLSGEDGRIEVEFEVDQNRNGLRWSVVLTPNTAVVFRGTRVTRAPSGSFELRRIISNGPGRDRVGARATSPSGEVCRASAAF